MTVVPARFTAFLNPDLADIVNSAKMGQGDIPTHCDDDVAKSQGLGGVGGAALTAIWILGFYESGLLFIVCGLGLPFQRKLKEYVGCVKDSSLAI